MREARAWRRRRASRVQRVYQRWMLAR